MSSAEKGDEALAQVDVLLNTGFGVRTDQQADIKKLWPKLTGLKWMHVASAGNPPPPPSLKIYRLSHQPAMAATAVSHTLKMDCDSYMFKPDSGPFSKHKHWSEKGGQRPFSPKQISRSQSWHCKPAKISHASSSIVDRLDNM